MTYYKLTCEVPGGFGNETIYDKTEIPWDIKSLHIRFDGWMGADIMTISSAVLITKKLQKSLGFNFTGILGYKYFFFDKSEIFHQLQPNTKLPEMDWLQIGNNSFKDDFALDFYNGLFNQLIISEKARVFLQDFNLGNYSLEIADFSKRPRLLV